jgi:ATP-dependent Lon protease
MNEDTMDEPCDDPVHIDGGSGDDSKDTTSESDDEHADPTFKPEDECDDEEDEGDDDDDEEDEDDENGVEEGEEGEEDDCGCEMDVGNNAISPIVFYLSAGPPSSPKRKRQRVTQSEERFVKSLSEQEWEYWQTLPNNDKEIVLKETKMVSAAMANREDVPLRFRILRSDMDPAVKRILISKLDNFNAMREGSGEYNKMRAWLNAVSRLPLGIYKEMPVKPTDSQTDIAAFIQKARNVLDETVYGHIEVKDQIMRIIAQWTSNPTSKGHVIGLQGMPGTGKTALVKQGIARALNLPFAFVALGGASDGSFLEGHGFTYEGSTYGKVADILMKTGAMNPVIFFDELDKVSGSSRGEEVIGILTHLTDPSQNERFNDRYFSELDLDLSKALIIFSYNDESLINPILKDRMITINVPGYTKAERKVIARDYLLPEILGQYNLRKEDIVLSDPVMDSIIATMTDERCGVRSLKRALESIISWINMNRYMPDEKSGKLTTLPIKITEHEIKKYMKVDKSDRDECPVPHMYL